jgi:hypothetical protein
LESLGETIMPRKPLNFGEKKAIETGIASGKTVYAVAQALGRDSKTVKKYAKKAAGTIAEIQEELSLKFATLANEVLDRVTLADIEKASLRDKVVSSGILLDKHRLINNQSIMNTSVFFHIVAEAPDLPPDDGFETSQDKQLTPQG